VLNWPKRAEAEHLRQWPLIVHAAEQAARICLVTPTGRDVTPPVAPCGGIGPDHHPVPARSPDSRRIAVHTNTGLYLMNANGTDLRRLRERRTNLWNAPDLRPAWRPK
jgi:hypothetical protein